MGLSRIEIGFYARALAAGTIVPDGDILELGESSLVPFDGGPALLAALAPHIPPERYNEALTRFEAAARSKSQYQRAFGPARAMYYAIFDPASYTAIDLDLGPRRYCLDLNGHVSMQRQFDYVINNGTSEHIFDQANVFEIMHNHTRPGGVMIHWTPCLGWANHGLYNVQPGFFFDLAVANAYQAKLIGLATDDAFVELKSGAGIGQVLRARPDFAHSLVCALLEKTRDAPFEMPIQGMFHRQMVSGGLELAQIPRRRRPETRRNLALDRPALQSSASVWSWHDDPARDAAGGNDGQVTGYYGFHTDLEVDPWWMVDLGVRQPVSEVVVYNRMDGLQSLGRRSAHLSILLSDDGTTWRKVFTRTEDVPFGGADGNPLMVDLGNECARYVRVSIPGKDTLTLDEIEVY